MKEPVDITPAQAATLELVARDQLCSKYSTCLHRAGHPGPCVGVPRETKPPPEFGPPRKDKKP